MSAPRYNRALPDSWLPRLEPGGPLHFLLSAPAETVPNDPCALDVQLREKGKLMAYHGTTRIVVIDLIEGRGEPEIVASAAPAYGERTRGCATEYENLMGRWPLSDSDRLEEAYRQYLPAALEATHESKYRNEQEGWWQNRACVEFGRHASVDSPWIVIDREAVLGFDSRDDKEAYYRDIAAPFTKVRAELQAMDPGAWGEPKGKRFGDELDMLALGPEGELVCIELKHGSNTSGIYWGPLQAATYRDAFSRALPNIRTSIERLVRQKVRLGLLPTSSEARLPGLERVEAILLVGDPNLRSTAWTKAEDVQTQCEAASLAMWTWERGSGGPRPRP